MAFELRALGYNSDDAWNYCGDLAYEAGLVSSKDEIYDTNFTKREAAEIMYKALSAKVQDGSDLLLIDQLIEDGHVNEYLAKEFGLIASTVSIQSVQGINLRQISFTINTTRYDEDEVTDEDNYQLEGIIDDDDEDIDVNAVEIDGKTIILTLEEIVDDGSEGTLTIDEDAFGKYYEIKDIQFDDEDNPEVLSAKVIDDDTLRIAFSEPINFEEEKNDNGTYIARSKYEREFDIKVDGKMVSIYEIQIFNDGLQADVIVYGSFDDGLIEVSIDDGLEDYAEHNLISKSFELTMDESEESFEVMDYEAEDDEVVLTFNKNININSYDEDDYYHTSRSNTVDTSSGYADIDVDDNELTLNFSDNQLPEGTVYIYIKVGALEDDDGNENEEMISVKVKVTEDTDPPEVDEIEVDEDEIIIYFDDELDEDYAEDVDNYEITDDDGDEIRIRDAEYGEDDGDYIVVLDLRDDLDDDVEYEIEIVDIEDPSGNEMDDFDLTFTLDDASVSNKFVIESVRAVDKDEILVTFDSSIDDFDLDDFYIEDNHGDDLELDSYDEVDDDEYKLYLDEDTLLPTDCGSYKLKTISDSDDINTENTSGHQLKNNQSVSIEDEILPEVVLEDNKDTDDYYESGENGREDHVPVVFAEYDESADESYIYIKFSEEVDDVDEDSFEVNNGDNEVTDVDIRISGWVIITVEDEVEQGDDIDLIDEISDIQGNEIDDLSLEIEYEVEEI